MMDLYQLAQVPEPWQPHEPPPSGDFGVLGWIGVGIVAGFIAYYFYCAYRDKHPKATSPAKATKMIREREDLVNLENQFKETLNKELDNQGTVFLSYNNRGYMSYQIFKSEWVIGITVLWMIEGFRITRSVDERALKRNPDRLAKETVRVLQKKRKLLEGNRKRGREIAEDACPSCGCPMYGGKQCGRCDFTE